MIKNKWERFEEFTNELEPIVITLNELFTKYELKIDDFISFQVKQNKIVPFINYSSFPNDDSK